RDLRKVYPPDRVVVDGVSLSFYYGAKIGVLGLNGAGKSTVLKIMAGLDPEFSGEARLSDGYSVGYLPQEPQLDPKHTVREIVEESVVATRRLLTLFEEVSTKLGEPMSDEEMEKLITRQADLQDKIEAANAWELDRTVEIGIDELRRHAPDSGTEILSGGERRRVALCRLLLQAPDLLLL